MLVEILLFSSLAVPVLLLVFDLITAPKFVATGRDKEMVAPKPEPLS